MHVWLLNLSSLAYRVPKKRDSKPGTTVRRDASSQALSYVLPILFQKFLKFNFLRYFSSQYGGGRFKRSTGRTESGQEVLFYLGASSSKKKGPDSEILHQN